MTDTLKERARALRLYGLVAHWDDIGETGWLPTLIAWEEEERRSRSLKRRLTDARIARFKPLADFDWDWPRRCDRMAIDDLMSLEFLRDAANVVLVGPNGVGKSTIAANLAHPRHHRGPHRALHNRRRHARRARRPRQRQHAPAQAPLPTLANSCS